MTLCILGRETLDELETMATECFSAVKTDDKPRLNYSHLPMPATPEVRAACVLCATCAVSSTDTHSSGRAGLGGAREEATLC